METTLLTPREVAHRLSVSPRTVYTWIESGTLGSVRLSERCTRVPASEVERMVREASRSRRPDMSSVLWDVDAADLDEEIHAPFLITRVLEEGRPEQVNWLFERYGIERIRRAVESGRGLSRKAASAWREILGGDA